MLTAQKVKQALKAGADPKRAEASLRFFKTGPGQYGEGDKFVGLTMGQQRSIAKDFIDLPFVEIEKLLASSIHEHRMVALVILTFRFAKAKDDKIKKNIFDFYIENKAAINNWDLVDVSVHKVVGAYLLDKPKERKLLFTLAKSKNLWDRRLAMVATAAFIRVGDLDDVFKLAAVLQNDTHDLIYKAVGWMLREAGKKDLGRLEFWLQKDGRYKNIPRTMLRYSIERLPKERRQDYIKGRVQ